MAWVYGADTFMEDLHTMLGFYPWPKIFWLWSWKIVSPALLLVGGGARIGEEGPY